MKIFLKLDYIRSVISRLQAFAAALSVGENGLYYINGADTLPAPLCAEDEHEALLRLEDGDSEARSLLIEHNLRLVVYIARKFDGGTTGLEDLVSIGTIGLIKAVNTYKSDKNIKLATYASRCIENEILMYMRKTSSKRAEISIDEPLNVDWDGNELLLSDILGTDESEVGRGMEKDEDEREIRMAIDGLTGREQTIIKLRYGFGGTRERTQKEVADMLGISQSYISRLEKKIICRLRDKIGGRI